MTLNPNAFDARVQQLRDALALYRMTGKSPVEVVRHILGPFVPVLGEGLGGKLVADELRKMADEVEADEARRKGG